MNQLVIAFLILASGLQAAVRADLTSKGVWSVVASDPYETLPQHPVTLWSFASSRINPSPTLLTERAVSTTLQKDNILPRFQKLVHANAICLKGRWVIEEESRYTGYYKKGTDAPFIGRASVAFTDTDRGTYRAFGLAGKIFHEVDGSEEPSDYQTANFFTIDDLAGTLAEDITAVTFQNEPEFTKGNLIHQSPSAAAIGAATIVAFKLADSNPGIRQLYEIADMGGVDARKVVTPRWMQIKGSSKLIKQHLDFRDDLKMSNFDGPLTFDISVSAESKSTGQRIGKIVIDESVASDSCDHRLHFHHPFHRNDLSH